MVLYTCKRCLCEFKRKSQYDCHINRKFKCNMHESLITDNVNENTLTLILEELQSVKKKLQTVENELCDVKKTNEILSRSQCVKFNETNNKKFVNNGTMNVNVVAFGKEKMDFVIEDICALCQGNKTIPNFIDFVHFNENMPENHNVYMPNRKNKNEVFVHNGEKWMLADKNKVIEDLIDKGTAYVEGRLEELKTKISKSKLDAVERSINAYNDTTNSNHVETTKKNNKRC